MGTKFEHGPISGSVVVTPDFYPDARGWLTETYHAQRYFNNGIRAAFVQDNRSRSVKNVLRGLHFQLHTPQARLIACTAGQTWNVAVDLRWGAPTFRQWFGLELSEENRKQLYIPAGFAYGFCVLSDTAEILCKCSEFYDPKDDRGLQWNEPEIGIEWPIKEPILSQKDTLCVPFAKLKETDFPHVAF